MEASVLGPYILLALGTGVIIAAVVSHFRQPPTKSATLMWIFGLAFLGIGAYGPTFLIQYAKFIKALNQVTATPGAESVASFLERAEKAGVSVEAREAILVEALGRQAAGEGNSALTSTAAYEQVSSQLPAQSENRMVLQEVRKRVEAEATIRDLANHQLEVMARPPEAAQPTRTIDVDRLIPLTRLDTDQLRVMRVNPETLAQVQAQSRGEGGSDG